MNQQGTQLCPLQLCASDTHCSSSHSLNTAQHLSYTSNITRWAHRVQDTGRLPQTPTWDGGPVPLTNYFDCLYFSKTSLARICAPQSPHMPFE